MSQVIERIQAFIIYLQAERAFSEHTARSYAADLTQYYTFLQETNEDDAEDPALEADKITLALFVEKLKRFNYEDSSIARKTASLRTFYKWLHQTKAIALNPMENVRTVKGPARTVKTITEEDLMALLAMPKQDELLGSRDLAMIQLVCATGVKIQELINLDREDLTMGDEPRIYVNSKKPRSMELDTASVVALTQYLELRAAVIPQDPIPLFLNKHGARLSGRSVRRKLDMYLDMAGIDPTINPSTLRHTYATHLMAQGTQPEIVAARLGYTEGNIATVLSTYGSVKPVSP